MTDNDTKAEAEALLQESSEQKRHRSEAPETNETSEDVSLQDAIREAYNRLAEGEMHENISVRDDDLAALFAGLDKADALEDVGQRAQDRLGREEKASSKTAVASAVLRVGLSEIAPDEVEAAKAGKREFLSSQADEF